jgi:hypothetical protein
VYAIAVASGNAVKLRVGIPWPGETCRLPDFLIKVWQSDFATEETIIFTEAKSGNLHASPAQGIGIQGPGKAFRPMKAWC